jgi:glucose-6-phosphate 1-dehydrogenase
MRPDSDLSNRQPSLAVSEPWVIAFFGGSGDAAMRMYGPGLYRAYQQELISPKTAIVGIAPKIWAGREWDSDEFRAHIRKGVEEFGGGTGSPEKWTQFEKSLLFYPGDINDFNSYRHLKEFLAGIDEERGTAGRRLFVLSLPPKLIKTAVVELAANAMLDDAEKVRIWIDKPAGANYQDACELREILAHQNFLLKATA